MLIIFPDFVKDLKRILPPVHLDEQAQIVDEQGWGAAQATCAVDEHRVSLARNQII
jgi:hypothetical protein